MSANRLLYLCFDSSDPSVLRRINHLEHLNIFEVELLGGYDLPVSRLILRFCLGKSCYMASKINYYVHIVRFFLENKGNSSEIVLAKNFDVLVIALLMRRFARKKFRIVYEFLDIPMVFRDTSIFSFFFGRFHGFVSKWADGTIISSKGFLRWRGLTSIKNVCLIENKFQIESPRIQNFKRLTYESPRICLVGRQRCKKSLEYLEIFSRKFGTCIDIWGELDRNFVIDETQFRHLRFLGSYRYPSDIERIYSRYDFHWCCDLEGANNAALLLPNRLYDGCTFGSIPIVEKKTYSEEFLRSIAHSHVAVDFADNDWAESMFTQLETFNYTVELMFDRNFYEEASLIRTDLKNFLSNLC